jgi:hypothetical protein
MTLLFFNRLIDMFEENIKKPVKEDMQNEAFQSK